MKKPAGNVTLSSEEGEALIAQVRQSNLPQAEAGTVEQIIRMYFWLVFALQEANLSVKRLRNSPAFATFRSELLHRETPEPQRNPC